VLRPQHAEREPAARRRRLVKRVYIPMPDAAARRALLAHMLAGQPARLSAGDAEALARRTEGYSGSDLAALCREAAMVPLRCGARAPRPAVPGACTGSAAPAALPVQARHVPLDECERRTLPFAKQRVWEAHARLRPALLRGEAALGLRAAAWRAEGAARGRELGAAVSTVSADQVRPIQARDFEVALQAIRPSVGPEQLSAFEEWTRLYGSAG